MIDYFTFCSYEDTASGVLTTDLEVITEEINSTDEIIFLQ